MLQLFAPANYIIKAPSVQSPAPSQQFAATQDAFRQQFGKALEMYRGGHLIEGMGLIRGFCLPEPEKWFAEHFAPEVAPHLAERYTTMCSDFIKYWDGAMHDLVANKTMQVMITQRETPPWPMEKMPARFKASNIMAIKEPDYSYFNFDVKSGNRSSFSFAELYVYEDGAFRIIGGGGAAFWHYEDDAGPRFGRWFGSIVGAVPISSPAPEYPAHARNARIEGTVMLRAIVAKDGKVKDVEVISGDPELRAAAIEAVRKWTFNPSRANGVPIEAEAVVSVNFKLGPH
jgi:TonB family protein